MAAAVDNSAPGGDHVRMTRKGLPSALIALLAVLALAAVAHARSYAVPFALGGTLDRTRAETKLAILLPRRLALDYGGRTHASGGGDRRSYSLSLASRRNCGGAGACFLATFTAERGSRPSAGRKVRLRGGRTGYFVALSCGASCSPPSIEWRSRGNVYSIQARIPDSTAAAQQRRLVAAANSALAAGPR